MRKIKIISVLLFSILVAIYLQYSGYLYHTDILSLRYSIHGLDISHHQEKINWNNVDKKYKFIILKATEGNTFLDTDFLYNWQKAQINGFIVGAYHYFTMQSSGIRQAKFYISKVPKIDNSFPPIIDLEISSKYDKKDVLRELTNMINILEEYYNKKVIIYVNNNTYEAFIKNELLDNLIWYSNYKYYPKIEEDNRWIMWQYSRKGRVKGISGYVDKNIIRYDIKNIIK